MIVTLTTDFSDSGGFIAQIKAILLQEIPNVTIIDVTHNINSFMSIEAAYILYSIVNIMPKNTIHLVIIDPGVGTNRSILAIKHKNQYIISPDNEALSLINNGSYVVSIEKLKVNKAPSHTFEARDIMAKSVPILIKKGIDYLGNISRITTNNLLNIRIFDGYIQGCVIHIDKFGNCITNIRTQHINNFKKITIKNITISNIDKHYCCDKKPKAIINSNGFLELAVYKDSFARFFNISYLDTITVFFK